MWVKTVKDRLINTNHAASLVAWERPNHEGWAVSDPRDAAFVATGTKEEMTAVLDRIARALVAGLPFLDLGTPEEGAVLVGYILRRVGANRLRVERKGSGGWEAMTYLPGAAHPNQYGSGPTPDAAIANLKPTGK